MPTLLGTSVKGMQYCGAGLMDQFKEFYFYCDTGLTAVPEQVGIVYLGHPVLGDTRLQLFFRDRLIRPGRGWSLANELLTLPQTVRVWANWDYAGIPWEFYLT